MVVEFTEAQMTAFAEDFRTRRRARFRATAKRGLDAQTLEAFATSRGVPIDDALDAVFVEVDGLGPERFESVIVYAAQAMEPAAVRAANAALFGWIDRMLARRGEVDHRLEVIARHIKAEAPADPDAGRIAARLERLKAAVT